MTGWKEYAQDLAAHVWNAEHAPSGYGRAAAWSAARGLAARFPFMADAEDREEAE